MSLDAAPATAHDPIDRAPLRRGLPVIVFVAVGFAVGEQLNVPAWTVAAVALVGGAG